MLNIGLEIYRTSSWKSYNKTRLLFNQLIFPYSAPLRIIFSIFLKNIKNLKTRVLYEILHFLHVVNSVIKSSTVLQMEVR